MIRALLFIYFALWAEPHLASDFSTYDLKPKSSSCPLELDYSYYLICYSPYYKQALWTYHQLTKKSIMGPQKRLRNYRKDNRVLDPVGPNDYKKSGFARGHLVPAGDMKLNRTSMSETFFMTNMSPQNSSFNSGVWTRVERHLRKSVLKFGRALVVTAPLFLEDVSYKKIKSGVSVPNYYYKIAYFPEENFMEAYMIANKAQKQKRPIKDFLISVNELEELTQIDFYSELEDKLEENLESLHSSLQ